jgi:hypothetical protein
MTREEVLDLITPRHFVEELENFDPAHMKYDTISFPVNTDRIDCSFRIFEPIFMKHLLENNETIYAVLESDDLTFQEKLEYLNGLKHLTVRTKNFNIPLLYKKNNICKFNYIKAHSGKVYLK